LLKLLAIIGLILLALLEASAPQIVRAVGRLVRALRRRGGLTLGTFWGR